MKLIIGLGNPGKEYALTRHNIGFQCLDYLHDAWKETHHFSPWTLSKRLRAEMSEGKIRNKKIILLKPQTFMNESGTSVRLTAGFYKIQPKDFFMIYDDLDIPFGHFRLRLGGSSGGHKGMQSVLEQFQTIDIPRLRVGIRGNHTKTNHEAKVFVLKKFTPEEAKKIPGILEKVKDAVETVMTESFSKAMNLYNAK